MAGHDRMTPQGKRFYAEIENLKRLQVRVGFQDDGTMASKREGDSVTDAEVSLLDVAMWNELGTANSPSRPFLRNSVDDNASKISAFCRAQLKRIAQGSADAQDILKKIGVMQKGLVQEKIANGSFEANAPSTVKKKGSDKPLIDTGRMRQSVSYVVRKKGG